MILIIDDESLVTRSLNKMLNKEGYNTVVVDNGNKAIDAYKGVDFDLIVCDVRMPGIDGIETIIKIRKLRDDLGRRKIPEILITGYADDEKYRQALNLKVADYIFKPFDLEQFLEIIKKNLNPKKK